jgi:D-glycero-alpha-D-manno-heptose-7-phosphate kinase
LEIGRDLSRLVHDGSVGDGSSPLRVARATAPIRICDNGGWTDTWFAGHGRVFNIAVTPRVAAQVRLHRSGSRVGPVTIHVESPAESNSSSGPEAPPERHPLIEATVEEIGVPEDLPAEIRISSEVAPGSSTGTSAAAAVALIAALDALTPGRMSRHEIAATAHRIEVDRLGLQSGVQDQLCAAYGGVNHIEVSAYPEATVTQIPLTNGLRGELERRLVLVCLGRPHVSSDVHDRVIAALAEAGGSSPLLAGLRRAADDARDAVCAGDLVALGRTMSSNTELQRQLHPDLVSADAQRVIDTAAAVGALGWKVNGAGGEGGSVTVLCGPEGEAPRRIRSALVEADPLLRVVPTTLSREGVRVWGE